MAGNLVGQTLGNYRILEQVGSGGMGVVYKAQDVSLGRYVALKVLPASASTDHDAIERFRREARTASALNHPNICTIYSFAEFQGQLLLAMELLDGEPLDKRIGGRPIDTLTLLGLATQIADALDAAHSEGVLHRDIKPANIYVTRRGQVKVLDFGLAKLAPGYDAQVTQRFSSITGTTVGTVSYMSPEKARGEELDHRTDMFSFGVVLYEMATGRQSFQGATTAVVFDGILNREPPPPRTLNASVSSELEHIILKALEKDRTLRYQTAADMRADLQRLKRDSGTKSTTALYPASTPAASPSTTDPTVLLPHTSAAAAGNRAPGTAAFSRNTKAALAAGGAVVLILAGALAMYLLPSTPAEEGPTPAVVAEQSATAPGSPATPPVEPSQQQAPPDAPTEPADSPRADQASTPAHSPAKPAVTPPAETRAAASAAPKPPSSGRTTAAERAAAERLDIAQAKVANNLIEPALVDLRELANAYPTTQAAADATLLSASLLDKLGRADDAMAALVEFNRRYGSDPRVADSKLRLADLTLKSRRPDRETAARTLYGEVADGYPRTGQAMQALQAKIRLETDRRNLRELDPMLGVPMPAVVMSLRALTQQFPDTSAAMTALHRLADLYEDADQYAFAAQALIDLGTRFPDRALDAWYRVGELYERRLKDPERARQAFEKVPPASPRYRDAQRKLKR